MRRVLVVDDDRDIRELARMSLELVGHFHVDTADSGNAALASLQERDPPDAVLLDVMMPGLDGLSLAHQLRQTERTRSLPIVLLTAKDHFNEVDLAQPSIRGVLSKPFGPMTLPARLSTLLGWADATPRY